ncbi:hypothetical protein HY633_05120 [Candidatus Uhrbacteria bacterium]|nr:hypothetical protein [Candidatus Uhrbacteria bacterium]
MTARAPLFCLVLLAACATEKSARQPPNDPAVPLPVPNEAPRPSVDGRPQVVIHASPIGSGWIGMGEPVPAGSPRLASDLWRQTEIGAEITIAVYKKPVDEVEASARKVRRGFYEGGAAVSEIVVEDGAKRAWFRLEAEPGGRRTSGKVVVVHVHDDPSMIAIMIGLWPPEHDARLAEEIDLMADNLTVTVY